MSQQSNQQDSSHRSATFVIPENDSEFYAEDELWRIEDECDDDSKGNRPSYLDLAGKSGSTPMSSRKPKFQFSGKH